MIGKLTTILEDCGIAAKRRDATDIGLPIEEELEDRLVAVSTRFGDDVVKVGGMRDCKRPETLGNVGAEHHCFGAGAKDVNSVFCGAYGMMFITCANDMIGAVSFQER